MLHTAKVRIYCIGNSGPASPGSGINDHFANLRVHVSIQFESGIPLSDFPRASRKSPLRDPKRALILDFHPMHRIAEPQRLFPLVITRYKDKTKYLARSC